MAKNYPLTENSDQMNGGWIYRDLIRNDDAGKCVIDFYTHRYRHSSRGEWLERINSGRIFIDGTRTNYHTLLRCGQELSYHRPPWAEPATPRSFVVVYEDEDVVAVAKPSGLQVIPGGCFLESTLLRLMRFCFGKAIAPAHRLGRGTSGIILFARTVRAKRWLSIEFQAGRIQKTYCALIVGHPSKYMFSVETPIGPIPYPPLGQVFAARSDGKKALSNISVIERRNEKLPISLVNVTIPTGRTHQIRIHLAAAGFPLQGEPFFTHGGLPRPVDCNKRPPLPGDCGYYLHAMKISFRHPRLGSRVSLYCQPPKSFNRPCSTPTV